MKRIFAGVDRRDLDRLADGVNLNLVDEVVSFVRQHGGRSSSVDLFLVIEDVASSTGALEGDVQSAFDIAYQDHRIIIDRNGMVKLVNGGRKRSAALKADKQYNTNNVSRVVAGLRHPMWVQDPAIWKLAVSGQDTSDANFWGNVILSYRKNGGRSIRVKSKVAEFQPRPFDVHPAIWTVSSDLDLEKDIECIQSFIQSGVDSHDLEDDMVLSGFKRSDARRIIDNALALIG